MSRRYPAHKIRFQLEQKIKTSLDKMKVKNYIINPDLTVDVNGDVDIPYKVLDGVFAAQFKNINGDFYCTHNNLTSLQGAPAWVGGTFDCRSNNLTSLQGAPAQVGGYFSCSGNNLTSLQGAPAQVGGYFSCLDNNLTSLEGAPAQVGGDFYCKDNNITSLHHIHKSIISVGGTFSADDDVTHLLSLLYIQNLKQVDICDGVDEIMNKYLQGDRDIDLCQDELIDAGFIEQAKL